MTEPTSPPFAERLQRMRRRHYEEWWHIVFTGPLGTLLAAAVADVRWITPNRLTCLTFAARAAATALIVTGRSTAANVWAVVLIQIAGLLDVTDGSLARYRRTASFAGAFFDKIVDAITFSMVVIACAYRVTADSGQTLPLWAALATVLTFSIRGYMYWMIGAFRRETPAAAKPPSSDPGWGVLSFGGRLAYYARSSYRLFVFAAAEIYLALCIGLLFDVVDYALYGASIAAAAWFVVILPARYVEARRLDRDRITDPP